MIPTYMYECPICDRDEDAYRQVDQRDDAPVCCGQRMTRAITAPFLIVSQEILYRSPIDDRPITSKQARIEDLARSGCRPYEPEMKQDTDRRVKEAEAKLEKAVDETVDREIALMPTRKREKLEVELQGGMTAEPIRLTVPAKPIRTDLHG